MISEKDFIIQQFIVNFISKDRLERTKIELNNEKKRIKFINRLNHNWNSIFNMQKLLSLSKVSDDYRFVKTKLNFKDDEICYVISNFDDIDDKFLEFKDAFEKSYCRGFGTLIMNKSANRIYLETEEVGNEKKFIGIVK